MAKPGYTWTRTGNYKVTTKVLIPLILYVARLELIDDTIPHSGIFYSVSITPFFSFLIHGGKTKEKTNEL